MKKYFNKNIWKKQMILNHQSIIEKKQEMIHIEIDISKCCNHHCVFCYTHGDSRKDSIDTRTITRNDFFPSERLSFFIDELHQIGCKAISFTGGGEPLLHKDIFSIIDKIHCYGIEVGLTTNFSVKLTDDQIKTLGKLSWIRCSVNASNKELYNKIHNPINKNCFDIAISNIKKLRKMNEVPINISFVICDENKHDILNIYKLAKRLKVNSLSFRPDVGYKRNNYEFDTETIEILTNLKDKHIRIDNGLERKLDTQYIDDDVLCYMSNYILFINVDGDVFPCCNTPLNKNFSYYNIINNSFVDFWNSDLYKMHYKKLNMRNCPLCHQTENNLILNKIYDNECFECEYRSDLINNFV